MARTSPKSATRTAESVRTTRKRRVESLQTGGDVLTSGEENTVRMRHGLGVDLHAPLATNAVNAAIRAQLLEIELRAYEATGRYMRDDDEDEPEARAAPAPRPRTAAKAKIVDKLRRR